MKITVFTMWWWNSWPKSISYSTPGLVSAQMGDSLAGIPSRRRNRHPGGGLLSVSLPSVGRWNEYLGQSGGGLGVNRHIT